MDLLLRNGACFLLTACLVRIRIGGNEGQKYMPSPGVLPVLETGPEVILVSPFESDTNALRRLLAPTNANVQWFPTCRAALAFLDTHSAAVVIAAQDLPDGCWKDLLDSLACFTPSPNLIVTSRVADERLWAEVLNHGGYDVLLTPFEPEEVLRVSTGAWLAWRLKMTESPLSRKAAAAAAGPD